MCELVVMPPGGTPAVATGATEIAQAANRLAQGHGWFAIDIERASGFSYDDRAFLMQIHRAGVGTVLIDVESDPDATTQHIGAVLDNADWVIHAATTDLPNLVQLGMYPARLFDTELSGRLLGFTRVNLAAMVEEFVHVRLQKSHGAENWSKRPLPQEWLNYAALDVEFLLPLADAMRRALIEQNKYEWAQAEYEHILTTYRGFSPPLKTWLDVKGLSTLKQPSQLQVARWLWETREIAAQDLDRACSVLLPDKVLVALAKAQPTSVPRVIHTVGYPPRLRRRARYWATEVAKALRQPRSEWPKRLPRAPRNRIPSKYSWSSHYPEVFAAWEQLRDELQTVAEAATIPVGNVIQPASVREIVWRARGLGEIGSVADLQAVMVELQVRPWQQELCFSAFVSVLLNE